MFDIGWLELLLIGIVALIVVGPKELPGLFRTVGRYMGKARGMAREFQRSMEQAADESGLKEAADGLKAVDRFNLNSAKKSVRNYAKSTVTGDDGKAKAGAPDKAAGEASAPADTAMPAPEQPADAAAPPPTPEDADAYKP